MIQRLWWLEHRASFYRHLPVFETLKGIFEYPQLTNRTGKLHEHFFGIPEFKHTTLTTEFMSFKSYILLEAAYNFTPEIISLPPESISIFQKEVLNAKKLSILHAIHTKFLQKNFTSQREAIYRSLIDIFVALQTESEYLSSDSHVQASAQLLQQKHQNQQQKDKAEVGDTRRPISELIDEDIIVWLLQELSCAASSATEAATGSKVWLLDYLSRFLGDVADSEAKIKPFPTEERKMATAVIMARLDTISNLIYRLPSRLLFLESGKNRASDRYGKFYYLSDPFRSLSSVLDFFVFVDALSKRSTIVFAWHTKIDLFSLIIDGILMSVASEENIPENEDYFARANALYKACKARDDPDRLGFLFFDSSRNIEGNIEMEHSYEPAKELLCFGLGVSRDIFSIRPRRRYLSHFEVT